jgi:asparagine synthase (glutamine-hydrolysing)
MFSAGAVVYLARGGGARSIGHRTGTFGRSTEKYMPGLFGIISKTQGLTRGELVSLGRRMADAMRRVPWLRTEIWVAEGFCGGRVHLSLLNPQPQPLITEDAGIRVWCDGEIYTPSATSDGNPMAREVVPLLRNDGGKLSESDGVFNIACFEPDTRELVLANDRLGLRPLYYTETRDWFAYAGEIKALLAIHDKLPALDEISLRQFFGFDHMLGERTWWKGIESLPPASIWSISAERQRRRCYWTFDSIKRDRQDPADVQVALGHLWSRDVERHSKPGTMPLLLSGGQDSRLLLAELRAQGADLFALTFGSKESPEVEIARLCAATAGVRHRLCDINTGNWWHHREEAIWQTDGLINAFNFQVAIATQEMHAGNYYSPMNIVGDLLFGGSHLDKNVSADWNASIETLITRKYVENAFFTREEIVAVSMPDARRYVSGPSSDCFHLSQRLRRFTLHGPGCLAPYCEIVFPGVRYAFLKLMLGSLLDEQRINHRFYNRWLVGRHPKYYSDIPWQGTGRGLAESVPTKLLRGGRSRIRRVLGRRARAIPADQWFVNYPECLRTSKITDRLLREQLLADEFLDGSVKRALGNSAGQLLSPQGVIAIVTFETYLRQVAGIPGFLNRTSELCF